MKVRDYNLPDNWKPTTDEEWEWYLVRKINYDDLKGVTREDIKRFFPKIKDLLDPGKRAMIFYFLAHGSN